VLEDDQPRETVSVEPVFWPTRLYLLVDNSRAITQSLTRIREGLRGLVQALPAEGVEIELVSIAPQPRRIVRMTADFEEVLEGIDLIAPDSGALAFVDSLVEASDRIDDDDSPHFPVVLIVAGNGNDPTGGMDRKLRRLQEQAFEQPVTHHFVIWSSGGLSAASAGVQSGVADSLSQMTGGRYEAIAAIERLESLLPEIGAQIATSYQNQQGQIRVTYTRPRGVDPPQQGFSSTVSRSGVGALLSLDGHMP